MFNANDTIAMLKASPISMKNTELIGGNLGNGIPRGIEPTTGIPNF